LERDRGEEIDEPTSRFILLATFMLLLSSVVSLVSLVSPSSRLRWILRVLAVLEVCAWVMLGASPRAHAQGMKIRVRGTAKIVTHASRDASSSGDGLVDLVLSGSLADDAGQPLPNESVTIHVKRESDPKDPTAARGLRGARSCDRGTDRPPVAYAVRSTGPVDAPDVVVVTDEGGRFCFRARMVPDRHLAKLSWRGTNLVDSADTELAFDLSRQTLVLRFDPSPRIVPLDAPRTIIEAAALVEDDATTRARPALALALVNEKNVDLGHASTDAAGRARFVLESTKLGPPGRGELRVSFAGDRDTAFATHVAEIERRAKVSVRVPAAERGELTPQVPDDGIVLVADVSTVSGPVDEGGVEARVGETLVGAAPVERGVARVTITFAAQGTSAAVRLRYVPLTPWYEPLGEPTVNVPIRGPGILSKAPILVAGLAVLAFFLVGRVASKSTKPEPLPALPKEGRRADAGKPRLDVVREAAKGETGWQGVVTDAHEGVPVRGARIWIERGTFEGRQVLASVGADALGRFQLAGNEATARRVGDEQMACEAPLHGRLVQPLPPPGELSIKLVLRRRALLARLVAWAKRRGKPFDIRPEPTPGQVKHAAGDDFQVARWADAIERAVFAGGDVDARAESEIDRMAPAPPGALPPPAPPAPPAPSAPPAEPAGPAGGPAAGGRGKTLKT